MGTFTKLLSVSCLAVCVGFISCTEPKEESGSSMTKLPALSDLGITHPVTSVNSGFEPSFFVYQNDRLKSGYDADLGDFVIQENPLQIHAHYQDGAIEVLKMDITNIRTNAQGFITSADLKYVDYGEELPYEIDGKIKAAYNAEGYLTQIVEDINTSDGSARCVNTFVWEDGKLQEMSELYEDASEGEGLFTCEFSYDTEIPNSGIYLFYEFCDNDIPEFLYYTGLFGKTTRCLPTSVTEIRPNESQSTHRMTVIQDEKGRVRKLVMDGNDEKLFTYDGSLAE